MRQAPKGNRENRSSGVSRKTLAEKEASVSVKPLKEGRADARASGYRFAGEA
ncbi:hypothetical protein P4055_19240 [Pseudomonas aeruginosa]|nr:hypothetical protein [Pseudomonas aeruginosa]